LCLSCCNKCSRNDDPTQSRYKHWLTSIHGALTDAFLEIRGVQECGITLHHIVILSSFWRSHLGYRQGLCTRTFWRAFIRKIKTRRVRQCSTKLSTLSKKASHRTRGYLTKKLFNLTRSNTPISLSQRKLPRLAFYI